MRAAWRVLSFLIEVGVLYVGGLFGWQPKRMPRGRPIDDADSIAQPVSRER